MKTLITMIINDESEETNVYAEAGESTTSIVILAKDMQEAKKLLPKGEELAKKAREDYKPGQDEEPAIEHVYKAPMSAEEAQKALERYSQDKEGGRFIKTVENALKYTFKKDKTGICDLWQYRYFELKACATDPYDAIIRAYAYGYSKAYKKAQREAKKGQ